MRASPPAESAPAGDVGEPALPPYAGLAPAQVRMVSSADDAAAALAALMAADALGFDTESKPTFRKGEVSTGPHLVQLATDDHAWLFQIGAGSGPVATADGLADRVVDDTPPVAVLRAVLGADAIVKAGFGLGDDVRRLRAKLGIETRNVVDLATALRRGERNAWGAKTAVARFFGQRLQKSRRITTTNWALPRLSEQQILYAADDAHVALRIYRHWRAHPSAGMAPFAPAPARGTPA